MLADLFSSLDGCSSFWSWLTPMSFCAIFPFSLSWASGYQPLLPSFIGSVWSKVKFEFFTLNLFLSALIYFLVLNNLIGLTPFTYGLTSSLWFNSSLALSCWACFLLSGWVFSPVSSAAHLTPSGAPSALIPFLVLIETISILIRPLTLSVRLMANMSAGHIVLGLMANVLSSSITFSSSAMIIIIMVFYYLFEFFVCFIQAYIFSLLVSLYSLEHPN